MAFLLCLVLLVCSSNSSAFIGSLKAAGTEETADAQLDTDTVEIEVEPAEASEEASAEAVPEETVQESPADTAEPPAEEIPEAPADSEAVPDQPSADENVPPAEAPSADEDQPPVQTLPPEEDTLTDQTPSDQPSADEDILQTEEELPNENTPTDTEVPEGTEPVPEEPAADAEIPELPMDETLDETVWTEEEQQQIEEVTALIEALPSMEEAAEKMAELEEDEEGMAAWYEALFGQITEAQQAYDALTQAQQEEVGNTEKLLYWAAWMEEAALLDEEQGECLSETYVDNIVIKNIADGAGEFDVLHQHSESCWEDGKTCEIKVYGENDPGIDTSPDNRRVRTFDAVTYEFLINMRSWDEKKTYAEANVKMEVLLPVSKEEAEFDLTAMGWMEDPEIREEERELLIDGETVVKTCQVLTGYRHLTPAGGNPSVVPGSFGNNVVINVKRMKNGTSLQPVFSAVMAEGWQEGALCPNEEHTEIEKKSVTADKVTVTAAPKYNIQIDGSGTYKDTFDFASGNGQAANKGIGNIPGRLMKIGVTLQLYNDNAAKGLKGIELPDPGTPIEFDLELNSKYQDQDAAEYGALLWSFGRNYSVGYNNNNDTDGRLLKDNLGCAPFAPYDYSAGDTYLDHACYNSGQWYARQEGNKIHVKVWDWEIDLDHMPTRNGDRWSDVYGPNIGCFSSGQMWILQPFAKKNSTYEPGPDGPEFEIVNEKGTGSFSTNIEAKNLTVTVNGQTMKEENGEIHQMVTKDDREAYTLELTLQGGLQNRIRYAGPGYEKESGEWEAPGSGVTDVRDGRDYAAIGSPVWIGSGFSYKANGEPANQMYWGTNLTKFYGSAIEMVDEKHLAFTGGAVLEDRYRTDDVINNGNLIIYYAAKKDGQDWKNDDELLTTYEDDLIFYKGYEGYQEIIKEGKVCVGMLVCFKGPGTDPLLENDPYYNCYHKAQVVNDPELIGRTFTLASTSRVWSKEKCEAANMTAEDLAGLDWSNGNVKLADFPQGSLVSANIKVDGTRPEWMDPNNNLQRDGYYIQNGYRPETYAPDGSGALGTHNSDWSHWGDTLLVIGCKTSITKNLLQKSGDEEKKSFDLDKNQRVVDFVLQPRTSFDEKGGGGNLEDLRIEIKITDTLPKHLSYIEGSAYYGGTYVQSGGGIQGDIENGTETGLNETVTLEDGKTIRLEMQAGDNEGETKLIWTISNVKVGEKLEPIRYSAEIGTPGNALTDVKAGTTNLLNKVYISAKEDLRDPLVKENQKYSEAAISVIRGSAESFGKFTLQHATDEDGEIDYVVYYSNNSENDAHVEMMDTMPANGVSGSIYTGDYSFVGWNLDEKRNTCAPERIQIYYTADPKYQGKKLKDLEEMGVTSVAESPDWNPVSISEDGIISLPDKTPVAWYVTADLKGLENVMVNLKIRLNPDPSVKDGSADTEVHYYVNDLSVGDTTVTTKTPTVRRTLEGLAWKDYNRNGVQDEEQADQMNGVKVELLKLSEGGDPQKKEDYVPVCYPNADGTPGTNPVQVMTGHQISIRGTDGSNAIAYTPNGDTGRYKFLDLPEGTYAVRFSSGEGEGNISDLKATGKDLWGNDEIDSDAEPSYENDKLQSTIILGIVMKDAESIYGEEQDTAEPKLIQESKFHDSGFYPNMQFSIQKTDESGTKGLAGASFTIMDAEQRVLSFVKNGDTYQAVQMEDTIYGETETEGRLQGALYYIAHANNPEYVLDLKRTGWWDAVLRGWTDTRDQMYEVIPQEDGSFAFKRAESNQWLNVSGGTAYTDGVNVMFYDGGSDVAHPEKNEKWYMRANKDGSIRIQAKEASAGNLGFLDISGGQVQENQNIQIWSGNHSAAQNWKLIPAKNADGTETNLTVDGSGQLKITDLIPGTYTITEMIAPTGYVLLNGPVKIQVNKDGTITKLDEGASDMADISGIELKIRNRELYVLPSAGGTGIYWYTISGTLLMIAGMLVLYKRKYAGRC